MSHFNILFLCTFLILTAGIAGRQSSKVLSFLLMLYIIRDFTFCEKNALQSAATFPTQSKGEVKGVSYDDMLISAKAQKRH